MHSSLTGVMAVLGDWHTNMEEIVASLKERRFKGVFPIGCMGVPDHTSDTLGGAVTF